MPNLVFNLQWRLYIGEAGKVSSIRQHEETLNEHNFNIKCTILPHENEIGVRKTLEALWIYDRNPTMSNEDESVFMSNVCPSFRYVNRGYHASS